MNRPRQIAIAAALSLTVILPARVWAGSMQVESLKLVEDTGGGDKKKEPPVYRAVVTHSRPGLKEADFLLKDLDVDPVVSTPASKVVTFKESDDKLALVVLIQGDERWMGNETYVTEDADRMDGAFTGLGAAIDALAKAGPPGSMGALLSFAGTVVERQAMGDISGLGAALGTQQDYKGIGVSLIPALDQAWGILAEASGRKVLVVFGDGTGQEEDISAALAERIKKLKEIKAQVYTVFYAGSSDDPSGPRNMKNLGYSGFYTAASRENFASHAEDIAKRIGAVYYVDFPAEPFATPEKKDRELTIVVDDEESEATSVPTVKLKPPETESSLWWLWLLIILVVLIIIIVIVVKKMGSRQPAPPPVVEEPVAAPAPAGPQKTVMLGIGGNDDGFPIVGWIVPLNGPNQYQTFKLLGGVTILGTGGAAHVVVDDQFMSTEHAEIVSSPAGFILKDSGSTNGTFVNEKRIADHELVDNDVFTMGQTNFKFKSIN